VFQYTDIDPVAVSIGPLSVRWYGLMYLLGFAASWLIARARSKRADSPIQPAQVDDLIFYAAIGVIIGGRVGYMLFYNLGALLENPLSLFMVWQGGMSFHGGLIGVLTAIGLFARRLGRSYFEIGDFVAPLVPLGLGFGRIGNFINGELWGGPTNLPWAFVVNGVARHPSQLYEALLEGLVLFIIVWLFSARPRPTMAVSGLFLAGYGVFRCLVETVRLPDEHIGYLAFGWLTMGMLLTLPMIIAGAALIWFAYRRAAAPSAV
jgi:phosphatidylglycerol:prolipoprotein diacylglycerol transferase